MTQQTKGNHHHVRNHLSTKDQREILDTEIFGSMEAAKHQATRGRFEGLASARVVNLISIEHMASNRPLRLDDLIRDLRENLDIDRDRNSRIERADYE